MIESNNLIFAISLLFSCQLEAIYVYCENSAIFLHVGKISAYCIENENFHTRKKRTVWEKMRRHRSAIVECSSISFSSSSQFLILCFALYSAHFFFIVKNDTFIQVIRYNVSWRQTTSATYEIWILCTVSFSLWVCNSHSLSLLLDLHKCIYIQIEIQKKYETIWFHCIAFIHNKCELVFFLFSFKISNVTIATNCFHFKNTFSYYETVYGVEYLIVFK